MKYILELSAINPKHHFRISNGSWKKSTNNSYPYIMSLTLEDLLSLVKIRLLATFYLKLVTRFNTISQSFKNLVIRIIAIATSISKQ